MKIKREETGKKKGGGSLGPVPEFRERQKKGSNKKNIGERIPSPDYLSARFARSFGFFRPRLFFSPFSPVRSLDPG